MRLNLLKTKIRKSEFFLIRVVGVRRSFCLDVRLNDFKADADLKISLYVCVPIRIIG